MLCGLQGSSDHLESGRIAGYIEEVLPDQQTMFVRKCLVDFEVAMSQFSS